MSSTVDTELFPSPRPRTPIIARLARTEPISPFVPWSAADREELPDAVGERESSLLIDLLRDARKIVERLLDPEQLQRTVLGSLVVIVTTVGFFAATVVSARLGADAWRAMAVLPFNALLGLAAALGPIYATSVLVAARLPLARLVATMLSASATGGLILAALAPIPYGVWKLDAEWAGPLSLLAVFGVSALVSGARLRQQLLIMAEEVVRAASGDPTARLCAADEFRVRIVARMAMVFVAFTLALAVWAFDALA